MAFDINQATKKGKPDLSVVKSVLIRFTELNIPKTSIEIISLNVDNLRYLSKTGNTKLNVKVSDDFEYDDLSYEDNTDSVDLIQDNDSEIAQQSEKIIRNKNVKLIKTVHEPDYLVTGIILGIEALVLTAATVLFIILYRKKKIRF